MPHGEHSAVDYYPGRLYKTDIENPHSVFHFFFDACSLPNANSFINGWLAAANKDDYWRKSYPAALLYFYEIMEKLIEAAYLLSQTGEQKEAAILIENKEEKIDLMKIEFFCVLQSKYEPWDYFPRNLSRKQYLNPYIAINNFFKYQNLPEWRDVLYDLLYYAFSKENLFETGVVVDLIAVQKHLKRLIEAAHLIEVRMRVKEKKGSED